jgi:hypothetical protein
MALATAAIHHDDRFMQFSATHSYQQPAADVFALLTDFDAVKEKYEAVGQTDVELVALRRRQDGSVTLVTRRVVPLDLPGFAKRVLSPKQHVVQTDEWSPTDDHGVRTGTFAVEAKGTPVRVFGLLRLAPRGAKGCTSTTDVTVECKVPLIGGRLAEFVAKDTRRLVDHEETWIRTRRERSRRSAP